MTRRYRNAGGQLQRGYKDSQPGLLVPDRDFEVAQAIAKVAKPSPDKHADLELPVVTGAKSIGFSARLGLNEKQRAIQIACPDEEASACSIFLDSFGAQCFAYLTFGVGGVFSELEIDIGRGAALDLVLSSLTVDLLNDSTAGTAALVKAFAGWLPHGGHPSMRPTRTLDRTVGYINGGYLNPNTAGTALSAIAAAGTRTIFPPPFARDIMVHRTPTNAFDLEFLTESGTLIYEIEVGAGQFLTEPVQISNDCKLVRLRNNGAVNIDFARAIFGLGV